MFQVTNERTSEIHTERKLAKNVLHSKLCNKLCLNMSLSSQANNREQISKLRLNEPENSYSGLITMILIDREDTFP